MEIVVWLSIIVLLAALWWKRLPPRSARGFAEMDAEWEEPRTVDNILTADECKYLIEQAEPKFARSTLVAETTINDTRTSESAWIPRDDPVVKKVLERAMELTGKPFENCEDLQVVRYKPGTYYRSHHDSCCTAVPRAARHAEQDAGTRHSHTSACRTREHRPPTHYQLSRPAQQGLRRCSGQRSMLAGAGPDPRGG